MIPDALYQNIIRCHYKRPTPVQKYGYSIGMAKRDLMACAQTGKNRYALKVYLKNDLVDGWDKK